MSVTYWYDEHPELLNAEKKAMQKFFPSFKLQTMSDQRLYWVGQVNPRGDAGGVWTLMAIYDHDHPSNRAINGSSIRVYSIKPDLKELSEAVGGLPHVWRDARGSLFICTSRRQDVSAGYRDDTFAEVTSAAKSLGWACKWIWLVEGWLNGEISTDDIFQHTY